jgi:hypothetical protein
MASTASLDQTVAQYLKKKGMKDSDIKNIIQSQPAPVIDSFADQKGFKTKRKGYFFWIRCLSRLGILFVGNLQSTSFSINTTRRNS